MSEKGLALLAVGGGLAVLTIALATTSVVIAGNLAVAVAAVVVVVGGRG